MSRFERLRGDGGEGEKGSRVELGERWTPFDVPEGRRATTQRKMSTRAPPIAFVCGEIGDEESMLASLIVDASGLLPRNFVFAGVLLRIKS